MRRTFALPLLAALSACTDTENPVETNAQEVVTTVVLTFTPEGGGDALEFAWADPENDGSPVIDPITLADADDYELTVRFLNELEDPAEEITDEVEAESDDHQVFLTGSAVEGPATGENAAAIVTHAYADADGNGLPVGMENTIGTIGAGSGELVVTLRHLPPENDVAVKSATTAEEVAAGGFEAIGGESDAQVTFELTIP